MEHPLLGSLEDKTLEELQLTMAGLSTKMNYACRIGNRPLINQLAMVVESYRLEYTKKLNKKMEELSKSSIDTTINISNDR